MINSAARIPLPATTVPVPLKLSGNSVTFITKLKRWGQVLTTSHQIVHLMR